MTVRRCYAWAMQGPLAQKNTEPGFFWNISLHMTRNMRLGLAELGDNSEQLLPGLAVTAGPLVSPTLFFLSSVKGLLPLGTPTPSSFPLPHKVFVCCHLSVPIRLPSSHESWQRQ